MKINLVIESSDTDDFREKILRVATLLGITPHNSTSPVVEVKPAIESEKESENSGKKARKPRAERFKPEPEALDPVPSDSVPVTGEEKTEEKPTFDMQDVKNALEAVASAKGLDAAREIVNEFGFQKFSEITPDKFDAIIEKANHVAKAA